MSAERWVFCPRCQQRAAVALRDAQREVIAAYGKVPAEEYEALQSGAREPVMLEETLREDYEFYLSQGGEFSAEFEARCTTEGCGFQFTFKYEEQVTI